MITIVCIFGIKKLKSNLITLSHNQEILQFKNLLLKLINLISGIELFL